MATGLRRRGEQQVFRIHEDVDTEATVPMDDEQDEGQDDMMDEESDEPADDGYDESSSSDEEPIDQGVQMDMEKLQSEIPSFREKFRLIKRIGEGTFSTVYKAEDLLYDQYKNPWDADNKENSWTPPPLRKNVGGSSPTPRRRRPKYVAIKKIYVTSSPHRILNELELLYDLRNCPAVCPLITAFRHSDQVVAVLPYFRHEDFRHYFRDMQVPDMAIYLRSLFTALTWVHRQNIIHRDIKPTNFLYEPTNRRGVLVDFGLAEREGADSKPCLCHETREERRRRIGASAAYASLQGQAEKIQPGYPKADTRPSRRANRAGTRGFRAPEVLFKCTEQTVALDVWSAGVILLTILSRRFPFFNSTDDVDAMIEMAHIFGTRAMRRAGMIHGVLFESSIPTIREKGYSLEEIVVWSTARSKNPLDRDEKLAVEFLEACLELDPSKRISAVEALSHPFLLQPEEEIAAEDDDMDVVAA